MNAWPRVVLRALVPFDEVLALPAEVRARAGRLMAAGERLDERVLRRAVGVEGRALAGAPVDSRHAAETQALVMPVAPVEAVDPDFALVSLRAGRRLAVRTLGFGISPKLSALGVSGRMARRSRLVRPVNPC